MWCLPVNSASLERHGAIVDILLVEAGNIFTVIKRKNMCVCVCISGVMGLMYTLMN